MHNERMIFRRRPLHQLPPNYSQPPGYKPPRRGFSLFRLLILVIAAGAGMMYYNRFHAVSNIAGDFLNADGTRAPVRMSQYDSGAIGGVGGIGLIGSGKNSIDSESAASRPQRRESPYAALAARGDIASVQELLARNREKDNGHWLEYATLMHAALTGNVAALPKGELETVNRIASNGESPLHIAAGNGSVEMLNALLARGGKVNLTNHALQTPLHWAAWNNQPTSVQLLLSKGADASLKDSTGSTALMLAAQQNHAAVIRLLAGR
jgi:hypothetical protein